MESGLVPIVIAVIALIFIAQTFKIVPQQHAWIVERLGKCQVAIDGAGRAVASVPPDDPRFEPALYWRGPIWPMINWVVHEGLLRYGLAGDAADIRRAVIALAQREGLWEHYQAVTGEGGGTEHLSWTAALVLDLLDAERKGEGGRR